LVSAGRSSGLERQVKEGEYRVEELQARRALLSRIVEYEQNEVSDARFGFEREDFRSRLPFSIAPDGGQKGVNSPCLAFGLPHINFLRAWLPGP
jgi:hypothetical protein